MIAIRNISASYGDKQVLHDISIGAPPGQFIALIGPNGSGKSTLLKTICGLITPSSGSIQNGDINIHNMPVKARAREIAYLAQARFAAPLMSVEDVVELGRAPYRGRLGKISEDGHAAIEQALERTQLSELRNRRFDSLSGGEQARVLLARALTVEAPVLLADEPIAALDPYFQITMMTMLKAEAESGKTVIAALHDLSLAHQFCDRIWVLHDGKLAVEAAPDEALNKDILRTVFGITRPKGGFAKNEIA